MRSCPKCSAHYDGTSCPECGFGRQAKRSNGVELRRTTVRMHGRDVGVPACSYNDHGVDCMQVGVWSPSTNAEHGPWFCRQHARALADSLSPDDRETGRARLHEIRGLLPQPKKRDPEAEAERSAIETST